jgi:hypothetical protein
VVAVPGAIPTGVHRNENKSAPVLLNGKGGDGAIFEETFRNCDPIFRFCLAILVYSVIARRGVRVHPPPTLRVRLRQTDIDTALHLWEGPYQCGTPDKGAATYETSSLCARSMR